MKVFDNETRGIVIESAMNMQVGGTCLPFEESLLSMQGATFGNRLVHADLHKDAANKLSLRAASGREQDENTALIKLQLWSPSVATRSCESLPGVKAEVLPWEPRCTQSLSGTEMPHIYTVCYVHALVTVAPGGAVAFSSVVDNAAHRRILDRLLGRKKEVTGQTTIRKVVSYDGNQVKIEESRTISDY